MDNLSSEHLQYSHPVIIVMLCNLFVTHGCVPDSFGRSYMLPIPKGNLYNRALMTVWATVVYSYEAKFSELDTKNQQFQEEYRQKSEEQRDTVTLYTKTLEQRGV